MDADPDPDTMSRILVLIILTFVNAIFSCAEMAMVSVNKNKIKRLAEEDNKNAIMILKFQGEPTRFLSTIQVAITLAGFFASASAATGFSKQLGVSLQKLNIPYAGQLSLIIVTLILSYFTLVFGELVPKRIALQKPEAISLFLVRPISVVSKIAYPFIKLLTLSTKLVMTLFGLQKGNVEESLSREEIKAMIGEGQITGAINQQEREMIYSIIEFDDKLAKEVMTPTINVFAINILNPIEDYIDELLEARYSRIPVYEDDIDNVIGILYIKDYLKEAIKNGYKNVDILSLLNKPYLVQESKNIEDLFRELQQLKTHIAILIDEYGSVSGIVTLEDLIEEIMGEIEDEYDEEDPSIVKIDNYTYIIDGLVTLGDLNSRFDTDISSTNSDTISGYLIETMGKIPSEGDDRTIEIDNMVFKLESIKNNRIDKIKLYIEKTNIEPENTEVNNKVE